MRVFNANQAQGGKRNRRSVHNPIRAKFSEKKKNSPEVQDSHNVAKTESMRRGVVAKTGCLITVVSFFSSAAGYILTPIWKQP